MITNVAQERRFGQQEEDKNCAIRFAFINVCWSFGQCAVKHWGTAEDQMKTHTYTHTLTFCYCLHSIIVSINCSKKNYKLRAYAYSYVVFTQFTQWHSVHKQLYTQHAEAKRSSIHAWNRSFIRIWFFSSLLFIRFVKCKRILFADALCFCVRSVFCLAIIQSHKHVVRCKFEVSLNCVLQWKRSPARAHGSERNQTL